MDTSKTEVKTKGRGKLEQNTSPPQEAALGKQQQNHGMKTQIERKTIRLHSQMMQCLSNKMMKVKSRVVLPERRDEPEKRQSLSENSQQSDSSSDADTDFEEEEPRTVRCQCVTYDEGQKIVAYERKSAGVGGCQFLRSPMSEQFNYFEVAVLDYGSRGRIAVGLGRRNYPLNRMPGWNKGSVAYHCHDGKLLPDMAGFPEIATSAQQGDVIGCGMKFDSCSRSLEANPIVFFTRNGEELGSKRMNVPRGGFFPIIGFNGERGIIAVHFTAKWESPSGNSDERLPDLLGDESIARLSDVPMGGFYPTIGMLSSGEEAELSLDAKLSPMKFRSARVRVEGNVIRHIGDTFGSVSVYQSTSRPMGRDCSYFEVTVQDYGRNGRICVGLATCVYPLDKKLGCFNGSIAWHCDSGALFGDRMPDRYTCSPGKEGDVIGCGVDFKESQKLRERPQGSRTDENELVLFFMLNGSRVAQATILEPAGGLFPTIGMQSPGEVAQVNMTAVLSEGIGAAMRSLGDVRSERVRIEGHYFTYVGNSYNDVGGVQLVGCSMHELSYFEVELISEGDRGSIGIGVAIKDYPLHSQPGWVRGSIAYHCDDGSLRFNGDIAENLRSSSTGDLIGCGIRITKTTDGKEQLTVFFTQLHKCLYQRVFDGYHASDLYPTICMHSLGETVKVNLYAQWQGLGNEFLFHRSERVRIDENKVSYDPDEYRNVGAVQLSRKLSYEYSYFEVRLAKFGVEGTIGVGLAPKNYPLDCEPGWLPGSVGYHCDGCSLYEGVGLGRHIRQKARQGDTIGCGVDYKKSRNRKDNKLVVFFKHNNSEIAESLLDQPKEGLYPTIGMNSPGEEIEVIRDDQQGHARPAYLNAETAV